MTADSLRSEVRSLLPPGAFLRGDRTGRALFVTRAGVDCAPLTARGWRCEAAGPLIRIAPGLPQLEALRPIEGELPLGAARFARLPADEAVLPLFTALLRALELPPPASQRPGLERQLRKHMAVALRTGGGGGLDVCAALFAQIKDVPR